MRPQHPLLLLALTLACVLSSCAGYRVGGQKPTPLAHVDKIYVPVFGNDTQFPRAAVIGTHSFLDTLSEDGTYRMSNLDQADARLEATIVDIEYSQARSSDEDVLRSDELQMKVGINWRLIDTRKSGAVLAEGTASGHTRFFAENNLQTARNNALPDALQRASLNIISSIADGF